MADALHFLESVRRCAQRCDREACEGCRKITSRGSLKVKNPNPQQAQGAAKMPRVSRTFSAGAHKGVTLCGDSLAKLTFGYPICDDSKSVGDLYGGAVRFSRVRSTAFGRYFSRWVRKWRRQGAKVRFIAPPFPIWDQKTRFSLGAAFLNPRR